VSSEESVVAVDANIPSCVVLHHTALADQEPVTKLFQVFELKTVPTTSLELHLQRKFTITESSPQPTPRQQFSPDTLSDSQRPQAIMVTRLSIGGSNLGSSPFGMLGPPARCATPWFARERLGGLGGGVSSGLQCTAPESR
jgi:hypothetical protein